MGFNWPDKPGEGGVPGDVPDFFTVNGKAYPETQPLRIKEGDVVRIRLIGAGNEMHSIHIHGHDFEVMRRRSATGESLPRRHNPVRTRRTLRPDPRADNPGIWMVHDHIDKHTGRHFADGRHDDYHENAEIPVKDQAFYKWKDKKFVPDFYYEESLKKPLGMYENPAFKGVPAP